MPVQSLNWNDKIRNLAGADNLSDSQKKSLLDQYNTNIPTLPQQLGYLPKYGATTNPSRSAVSVVASAYDTSGNGGRKVVRLANGWIIIVAYNSTGTVNNFYVSKDNFATTPTLLTQNTSSANPYSLVSVGNKVYGIAQTANETKFIYFDATTVGATITATNVDSGQTDKSGHSLTYSPTDNTLHAAWASKNSTYPNSFNIRYAKGTINADGSVTWGSVTQLTTANTTGQDYKNPTNNGNIANRNTLVFEFYNGTTYYLYCYVHDGTNYVYKGTIYSVATYVQSNPSATVDGTGAIHVVWHGLDATDTIKTNIRYSKSTDGGVTWSAMTKLTTGNTYDQWNANITYDQNNNLYVYFEGGGASWGGMRIRSLVYNGSWSSVVDITSNTTGVGSKFASLCDNIRTFTSPLVIWQDNVSPSVKFSGTWTDTPLLSETTSISAVSNKALIDAWINKNYPSMLSFTPTGGTNVTDTNNSSKGTNNTTATKLKEFTMLKSGTFRFSFTLQSNDASNIAYARLYVNDVARGTLRSIGTAPTVFTEDLTVNSNDKVQVYGYNPAGYSCTISNYTIGISVPSVATATIQ